MLAAWPRLAVNQVPMTRLLPRVWAQRDALTASDAMVVGTAEALGVPLETCDRKLAQAGRARCNVEVVPGAN